MPPGNKVDLVAWPDLPMPEDEALQLGADGAAAGDLALGRPAPPAAPDGPPVIAAGLAELEQGKAMFGAFRKASDLVDWPVLFWGPTAWFVTESIPRSVELAVLLAELDGADHAARPARRRPGRSARP